MSDDQDITEIVSAEGTSNTEAETENDGTEAAQADEDTSDEADEDTSDEADEDTSDDNGHMYVPGPAKTLTRAATTTASDLPPR